MRPIRLAIFGATGAVGRTALRVLEERGTPIESLTLLASPRSEGTTLTFQNREVPVHAVAAEHFDGVDAAIFSSGGARSLEWAPVAAERGVVVVDNSSAWRMHDQVPLVVPEVNSRALANRPLGIIANPNCSTIQLVVALAPLAHATGLTRVDCVTFQAVSGAGQGGTDALHGEESGSLDALSPFKRRIARNVVPQIGPFDEDGWAEEELKMRRETRKILGLSVLPVTATCVRVPVETSHSVVARVRMARICSPAEVAELLESAGVIVHDTESYPTPIDVAGDDAVHVGRIRSDPDDPFVIHLWIVADNLRKGAATNAVQIVEALFD